MASVASMDGTSIDYDIAGTGPVIVFVAGVFDLRDTFTPLAAEFSSDHTVLSYDRRGRGKSSDTAPYSIEREVEDLRSDHHGTSEESIKDQRGWLVLNAARRQVIARTGSSVPIAGEPFRQGRKHGHGRLWPLLQYGV